MGRKLSVGALVAALLVSGLLVGVSQGGPAPITDPQVIELRSGQVLKEETDGVIEEILEGGDLVGVARWNDGAFSAATIVYVLKDRPDRGTIVATGTFRGFNGERLAITGGTGAFVGVGGYVRLTVEGGEFAHTLHLIP